MINTNPIIVIEDDVDDLQLLTDSFADCNILNKMIHFTSGREAIDHISQSNEQPLFILCDVNLPKQNGIELKKEMVAAAWREISLDADLRTQMSQVWSNWMERATAHPDKRRAVALLGVSEDLSPATRQAVQKIMAPLAALMERVRALGSMRQVPMAFVGALVTSMAEATMDFMIQDPAQAKKHCQAGFEAFWRAIS